MEVLVVYVLVKFPLAGLTLKTVDPEPVVFNVRLPAPPKSLLKLTIPSLTSINTDELLINTLPA